tara:strand:+ start:251 stop:1183 length:933 start_codon:yes stop_codon:yes gene_type:complete
LEISWDTASRTDWNRYVADACKCPFEQSWSYGEAMVTTGSGVKRAIFRKNRKPVAFAQLFTKKIGAIANIVQLLRGPVFFTEAPDLADRFDSLRLLQESDLRLTRMIRFWTPEILESPNNDSLFQSLKLRRIMTGYNTIWLNLNSNSERLRQKLEGNWRNGLVKAEKQGLKIRESSDLKTIEWITGIYEVLRKKRRFGGASATLLRAAHKCTSDRSNFIVLQASLKDEVIAAILLVRHGKSATYVIGWNNDVGRQTNANALLLWQGMLVLKNQNVSFFDLGGIDTRSLPGIARFKLGMGGDIASLAGTYF